MRKPKGAPCAECDEVAALKVRASAVERVSAGFLARGSNGNYEAAVSPSQQVAADWSVSVGTFLRRRMRHHRRCAACSILMGPGHLESGRGPSCSTCHTSSTNDDVDPPAFGRRGWDGVQGTQRSS